MGEKYGQEWCRKRHLPSINVIHMLRNRELGIRKPGTHFFNGGRQFYQCFFPSYQIPGVDRKNLILKRFSADGRYLVCFTANMHTVSVRDYVGFTRSMCSIPPSSIFEHVFPERFSLNLVFPSEEGTFLNKDAVFITADSRHLIVATECPVSESVPTLRDVYTNNESLISFSSQSLDNVFFYCIDLEKGVVRDVYRMKVDRVWVSHGAHLVGRFLAILSIQQQTIHIVHVDENSGRFYLVKRIGRFLFDDDEYMVCMSGFNNATAESCLSGIKQRLLAHMLNQCKDVKSKQQFLSSFSHFRSQRMWQMQLVNSDVLLIRFVSQEAFASHSTINSQPSLFVFMNWKSGEVLRVFERFPSSLLTLLESCQEEFKHPHILDNRFPSTMQHCQHALVQHSRLKCAIETKGDLVSQLDMRRRILSQLPYSTALASTESPYLDPAMFSYDDRLIILIERMKITDGETIKFYSRLTSQPLFSMKLSNGHYIQLLMHPTDPFGVSVDRSNPSTMATFHTLPPTS